MGNPRPLLQQLQGRRQRQLRRRLARQHGQHAVEGLQGRVVVVEKQFSDARVPAPPPVPAQTRGSRPQIVAGLLRGTDVQLRANDGQGNLHRRGILRVAHGGGEGVDELAGLRERRRRQQPRPRVRRVDQRHRQGGGDLLRGDDHVAGDAVDQLIGAEHPVLRAVGRTLRRKQRADVRVLHAVANRQDLAQHAGELDGHVVGAGETHVRVLVAGAQQQPVQRQVPAEHGFLHWRGQARVVDAVGRRQVRDQRRQRAADGVDVRRDRRARAADLGGLEAGRAVDVAVGADAGDRADVDELDLVFGDEHVVGLEVVVDHAPGVQVVQGRKQFQDVADGDVDGHEAVGLGAPTLPQRRAADVLHDDEAGLAAGGFDEVDDLHDPRVRDLREELAFGLHDGEVAFVGRGHHALEHDPAVGHVVVLGQVDPAEAAVGDGAGDFVLAGDEVARGQRRGGLAGGGDFLRRHDGVERVGRRDERQLHHAVGDGAALAGAAAAGAEGVQGAAVRFGGRVDGGGRSA